MDFDCYFSQDGKLQLKKFDYFYAAKDALQVKCYIQCLISEIPVPIQGLSCNMLQN